MSIQPVTELTLPRTVERVDALEGATAPSDGAAPAPGFADLLTGLVASANSADAVASKKVEALASGLNDDLHGTMIAVKEADISVKLVASIRNKLLDAFNDIWKTSV